MRTTSIIATGRLLTCAALALGLTGLGATVVRANDPEGTKTKDVYFDVTGTVDSPCTTETIETKGTLVVRTKMKESAGKITTMFSTHDSGSGTVAAFPDRRYKYLLATQDEARTSKTSCNFTSRFEIRNKIKLVHPEWRNDDFSLYQLDTWKSTKPSCELVHVSRTKTQTKCKG